MPINSIESLTTLFMARLATIGAAQEPVSLQSIIVQINNRQHFHEQMPIILDATFFAEESYASHRKPVVTF